MPDEKKPAAKPEEKKKETFEDELQEYVPATEAVVEGDIPPLVDF